VAASETRYAARDDLKAPGSRTSQIGRCGVPRAVLRAVPIKRIGRDRFVRNVLYAIGNSASKQLLSSAERLTQDKDPAVADAARWAVERLR
jgi:epoxyqueuosine reductase